MRGGGRSEGNGGRGCACVYAYVCVCEVWRRAWRRMAARRAGGAVVGAEGRRKGERVTVRLEMYKLTEWRLSACTAGCGAAVTRPYMATWCAAAAACRCCFQAWLLVGGGMRPRGARRGWEIGREGGGRNEQAKAGELGGAGAGGAGHLTGGTSGKRRPQRQRPVQMCNQPFGFGDVVGSRDRCQIGKWTWRLLMMLFWCCCRSGGVDWCRARLSIFSGRASIAGTAASPRLGSGRSPGAAVCRRIQRDWFPAGHRLKEGQMLPSRARHLFSR